MTLNRRSDYRLASQLLMLRETMDFLTAHHEGFRMAAKGDQNIFEFDTFEKIFRKKSLLMGLGSHKILDYLSLGVNLPV